MQKLKSSKWLSFPWHVLFLSWYSILSFLARNISQVNLNVANRLIVILTFAAVLLTLILRLFLSNFFRAGALAFLILLVFFSYEHVKIYLLAAWPLVARDVLLVPAFLIAFSVTVVWVLKWPSERIRSLNLYLNLFTVILLFFPIISLAVHQYRVAAYQRNLRIQLTENATVDAASVTSLPDVYFIVLDGYARSDALKLATGLDNSPFLDELRQRNFYVADCSMSNYAQTELSIASTFNMEDITEIIQTVPAQTQYQDFLSPYIKNSQVRQFFESMGYQTVSFYNGYYWAQWDDATYFLGDPRNSQDATSLIPFEEQYLQTTFLRFLSSLYKAIVPADAPLDGFIDENDAERTIVRFTLDNIPVAAELRSPKFVFVHLILPHPPYVFSAQGEEITVDMLDKNARLEGYRDQVLYANSRIIPVIDSILAQSNGNAIIFLEGDHGLLDYEENWMRMANLSAYYFPDHDYSMLYSEITPVNSFRVLLTQYFGQDYPLLEDFSFYSSTSADRIFTPIENRCTGGE